MLLGSAADLRKTADQQYVNQSMPMFKVLTYDHRNTGQSTIKDEPCTMEDYADDAAALLRAVVPERLPVKVVGISFGGMVAQHLALRHPQLVKGLVLCCSPSGGDGGSSYPVHEWYAPGVTVEERVRRKIFQANTDRTEAWTTTHPSEWQMSVALLTRDEQVGLDTPLCLPGIARQLEARRAHDTWETLPQLSDMEVLVCGSSKDGITPARLLKKLVDRIGRKCDSKLDFDWGHAFVAADVAAMPYINEWLRRPAQAASVGRGAAVQCWKVVGGIDKGGIIVRTGEATSSPLAEDRLATDSLVEELAITGDRLQYRLIDGVGPATGWVSRKLAGGKELLVKTDDRP